MIYKSSEIVGLRMHDLDDEFLFGLSHKVFISSPEQVAFGGGKVEKDKINPDDYQLIINTEDGELSLGVVVGVVEYQVPATYTTKDGTVAWLTVPKAEFHKKMNEIALKQKEEKERRISEENLRIKQWEDKFDKEQKMKEDELIKKFYSDRNSNETDKNFESDIVNDNSEENKNS